MRLPEERPERAGGHLVYTYDGTLLAAPFDLERLEVMGPAVLALEGVASNTITGGAQFAVSATGTLAYLPGHTTGPGTLLLWMDQAGETTPLGVAPANWFNLRFAPDGRRLVMDVRDGHAEIWVYDVDVMILPVEGDEVSGWKPGKPTAFLNSPSLEAGPMFSPDGRWLAYSSDESGAMEVYVRPFRGPGGKSQISTRGGNMPTWSRTKRELFYGASRQIMVATYTVDGDSFRPREAEGLVRGTLPDAGIEPHVRSAPWWGTVRAPARRANAGRYTAGPRDVHLQFLRGVAPHRPRDNTMTRLAVTGPTSA